MKTFKNNLSEPINAFVFDCDGTLSLIEGIEILAEQNGAGERVRELTEKAMSETGLCPNVYQERLQLVQPHRRQVIDLAQQYYASRVPQVVAVIETLQSLDKAVYVVSAGVNPAVQLFAVMLGVPSDHVVAVDLDFDEAGDYLGYDEAAHPAQSGGKRVIADQIKAQHQRLVWIGDGMNDLVVKPDIERFIGYGGAFYRKKIAAASDYYIKCQSMAPLLPLGLTQQESDKLTGDVAALYAQGLELIQTNMVEFTCV